MVSGATAAGLFWTIVQTSAEHILHKQGQRSSE